MSTTLKFQAFKSKKKTYNITATLFSLPSSMAVILAIPVTVNLAGAAWKRAHLSMALGNGLDIFPHRCLTHTALI